MNKSIGAFALVLVFSILVGCSGAGVTESAPASSGPASAQPANGVVPPSQPLGGGSKKAGSYVVWLASVPPQPVRGVNVVEALVVDANGQPVTDATVSFDTDMTNMSHGKNLVLGAPNANGRYAGKITFAMPGPWRVIVNVERKDRPAERVRFDFTVNFR